jgi:O-6-methylguanine DNA methyltransferase
LTAGTKFQKKVWNGLRNIPPGEVESYAILAEKIGLNKKYARAVGSANSKNPLAIIIPCHRVRNATGKITGFSGGPIIAQKLISHERRIHES